MNLIQLSTLAILFVFIVLNYIRYKDALYPPVMQGTLWFLVIFLFILNQSSFVPLSNLMYFVIMIGVATFSIGSYLATFKYRVSIKPVDIQERSYNKKLVELLFWVSIVGLPFFIYKAYSMGLDGLYESYFMNLRDALVGSERTSFGILSYLVTISFISAWMQLMVYFTKQNKVKLALSLLIAMLYAFFTLGRTFFILLFISFAGILLIMRKISFLRAGTYLIIIGMAVFVGMGFLLAKGADIQKDMTENISTILESFQLYLLGSLPAFDIDMHKDFFPDYGKNIFRTFLAIMNKLDSDVTVPSLIKEYDFVPSPINVYTIYQPYFRDFYYFGILGVQCVAGFWHGFLYKKATEGKPYFIILYAVFLYPLFMQFFQDQYMSLLSQWIQFGLIIFICFYRIQLYGVHSKKYAIS